MSDPQLIGSTLRDDPIILGLLEDTEPVTVKCAGLPLDEWGRNRAECDGQVHVTKGQARFARASLCCDECIKKYDYDRRTEAMRESWTRWMRDNAERYAHFSTEHAEFNKPAYEVLRKVGVSKNVILYGPTGTGKTFLMLQQLKRGLWFGKGPVRVLWADQLKKLTAQRYNSREMEQYEQAGILGLEELFGEDSAREAYTSFVRNLIDIRLRLNRPTIITTQLKSEHLAAEMNKFDNETRADVERRSAIIRRINEDFKPIPTDRNFDHDETEAFF
jgi:DNA replication protein DnaC